MNLYQETGIKRLVHDTESEYIREKKISEIEELYKKENIPFINTTRFSIEEIATKIMAATGIKRKLTS